MLKALRRVAETTRQIQRALSGESYIYEANEDSSRFHMWSGDHFIDLPGSPDVYLVRPVSREYFEKLKERHPDRVHLIVSPSSPHLRLLP